MKAIVCERYGSPDILQIREVEKPTPKDNEVLVRIHATTVTIGDTMIRRGKHPDSKFYTLMLHLVFGLTKPKRAILGMELSGIIESTGKSVHGFKPGDQVFASTFKENFGGHAEYKCLRKDGVLAIKPANISFEEAAAVPGAGMTALQCLRKGKIQSGKNILINGASGAVGSYAVQLAKHFGAEVTGVCSTTNIVMVKSLGAQKVIDYTQEDFTKSGEKYDIIFDAVAKISSSQAKKALKKSGRYLNVLKDSGGGEKPENLIFLKELIEAGKIKPLIDRSYPFDQIPEAHSYVQKGHKKGNVAITIIENRK